MKQLALVAIGLLATVAPSAAAPTVVNCIFEKMPPMVLTFRGGMGATDNTLKIGRSKPVRLSVGSSLMIATYGAQELTFSLRLPASVTVKAPGQNTTTYHGECVSSLQ